VSTACTNGGNAPSASRDPSNKPSVRRGASSENLTVDDDGPAAPSTETTSASGQPISGRQLLQASRARFTRPLPTVVPAPVSTIATVPTTTPTPPTTEPPGPPKDPPGIQELVPTQTLIARALEEGKITYAQSLLYRAYALFWDPRLPADFDGMGSTGEDDFFTEARLRFAQLDAGTQAALAPFLERPASPTGYGCPVADNTGQPVTWQDSGGASAHFKVWACGTDGAADDIAKVIAILDDVYPTMADPAGMGPALPDSGTADDGGDPRIDVYLLDTVSTRERSSTNKAIEGLTIAAVSADDPFVGEKASSYLMLGRSRVANSGDLRRALVHELFHSLQYAHNYAITTVVPGRTPWFFEASAAWAEWQFFRASGPRVHADYFVNGFRTQPELPLELPTAAAGSAAQQAHARWAYLWPFFMQQEAKGDPAVVLDTWKAVEGAGTWDDFHAAIDQQLPFATAFRDFTVRNLNLDLGSALQPRYDALDAGFPTGSSPSLSSDFEITQQGMITMPVGGPEADGLPALSTQYDLVAVGPQSNTSSLVLDFTAIPKGMDVTVLTQATNGAWTRHDLAAGDRLEVDFTTPGGAVSRFYVILGNSQREPDWNKPGADLRGSYEIATKS
jgi:hypothetical protein